MDESQKEIWVFLSHSSADFEKVRLIRNYLEENSFRPLMFYLKCLESDEEIYNLITREIDVRTRFILCDSKNARASKWVKKEMDYITSVIPKRSYEILDLSQPLELLKNQIDSYIVKANLYISYSRRQQPLFDAVYKRLSKYDLRIFNPQLDFFTGSSFKSVIEDAISQAADCGYFIVLADDNSLNNWVMKELEIALKHNNADIIIIALTQNAYDKFTNILSDTNYDVVNLQASKLNGSIQDKTADLILSKVLTPRSLITHESNFRHGINSVKDIKEADRLAQIIKM